VFALPDRSSFFLDSSRTFEFDARLVERHLDLVCAMFPDDESHEFTPLQIFDTSTLVANVRESIAAQRKVKFDSFFRFVDFPDFDRFDFVDPAPPFTFFVTAITELVEQVSTSGLRTIYADTEVGSMFVFLIASLLLNGLRDSLLPAMVAFQDFFPELEEIVNRASQEPDQNAQASIIALRLLNANCIIPFLKTVSKREPWVEHFYHKSAQIACDAVLEMSVMILTPLMNILEFALEDIPDIVAKTKPSLLQHFITEPAFAYLEIDECRSPDDLGAFVARQLTYGLKVKRMHSFSLHVPQFLFILDVANQHFEFPNDELMAFVAFTKKLAEDGTALSSVSLLKRQNSHELWIAEALRRRVLPSWLLFLIVSKSIVVEYYEADATLCDLYRANHFVAQVYRIQSQM
jgi:hypothetical protein